MSFEFTADDEEQVSPPEPQAVCACGGYEYQHEENGACRICAHHPYPYKCKRFRFDHYG